MIQATMQAAAGARLRIRVADTLPLRVRGLLGRPAPAPGEGLLITRCKRVHTVGMAYCIDVLYLDRDGQIVGVSHGVRPGRWRAPAPPRRRASAGTGGRRAVRLGLRTGGRLHGLAAA